MSQHTFTAVTGDGRRVGVLTGWDRPLQGFFLVVEEVGAEDENYVFTNLDLPAGQSHPKDYRVFQRVLDELGVSIPDGLLEELLIDQALNAGNKRKIWTSEAPQC